MHQKGPESAKPQERLWSQLYHLHGKMAELRIFRLRENPGFQGGGPNAIIRVPKGRQEVNAGCDPGDRRLEQ